MRLIIMTILVCSVGFGQDYQRAEYGAAVESMDQLNELCPEVPTGMGFNPGSTVTPAMAKNIVKDIMQRMGIRRTYNVRECKAVAEGNARAKIYYNKEGRPIKWIVYDADFLNEFNQSTNTAWSATFILAHEIGHHQYEHSLEYNGSNQKIEKEADYYAGFQLARMGATLEDILKTPRATELLVTSKYATHPGRIDRMREAFTGWYDYISQDSIKLKNSAGSIKRYYDEVNGYRRQLQPKEKPKEVTATKEKIDPIVAKKEEKEKKEHGGAATVLKNYFAALGGITKVNAIKSLTYSESTTRSNLFGQEFHYDYDQKSSSLLYIYNRTKDYDDEVYRISNDTIYHRFGNKSWKEGVPYGDTEESFRAMTGASTGDFLEEFSLFSSPNLVSLKDTLVFKEAKCYRLEVKETLKSKNINKKGKGTIALVRQNRYYSESTGLLHATEIIQVTENFKNNRKQFEDKEVTVTLYKDYQEVDGVKFPHRYEITSYGYDGNSSYELLEINKTVSDIVLNPVESD